MSTVALNLPFSKTPKSRWIISPANDLTWFILSAIGGYATILLFKVGVPLTPVLIAFIFLIDGPHVWSTMTRTYFDKSERKKHRLQLFAIVPLLLVGPLMWLLGYASLFFVLAYGWAYYHHAKQEYGFVMLYKAKNRDRGAFDMTFDRRFIMASLILPYACRILRPINNLRIGITVTANDSTVLLSSKDTDDSEDGIERAPGTYFGRCTFPGEFLNNGQYFISLGSDTPMIQIHFSLERLLAFHIEQTGGANGHIPDRRQGLIRMKFPWETEKLSHAADKYER